MKKMSKKITLNVVKLENQSWDKAFQHNLEALDWAIKNAPFRHAAPLIDTKTIICEIQSKLLMETHYGV